MLQGKVYAALCLLSDHESGLSMQLDKMIGYKSVTEILLDKHPPSHPLDPHAVTPLVSSAFDPYPVFLTLLQGH